MDLINFSDNINNSIITNKELLIPKNTVCINKLFYDSNLLILNNNSLIYQTINKIFYLIIGFSLILLFLYFIKFYQKNKHEIKLNNFIENTLIVLIYPLILLNLVLKVTIEKDILKFSIILILIELLMTPYIYIKLYENCIYLFEKIKTIGGKYRD